jgi:hypothetical protein
MVDVSSELILSTMALSVLILLGGQRWLLRVPHATRMMSRISADLLIQLRHEEEVSSVAGNNSVAHYSFL